uniref:Uncharacterized protein n=1 Tax=Arundo donax TaxID=35708 RepID=A0A0A8XQ72_ARUDO
MDLITSFAFPGSCATSSQISMFFPQSISLSLSLVAAFTISEAIFSRASFNLLSLSSLLRPANPNRDRPQLPQGALLLS